VQFASRCTKTSDGKQVTGWPRVAFSLRQRAVGREAQQSGNSNNKFPGLASQSAQVRTRPMRVSTRAEDLECKIFGMCEWQIQNVLYFDGLDQNLLGSTVLNAKSLESGHTPDIWSRILRISRTNWTSNSTNFKPSGSRSLASDSSVSKVCGSDSRIL
jgi:hypothetical protein